MLTLSSKAKRENLSGGPILGGRGVPGAYASATGGTVLGGGARFGPGLGRRVLVPAGRLSETSIGAMLSIRQR
jgi:hypothetical protein